MISVRLKGHFQIYIKFHGRAGRGDKVGRVIIQTYDTQNYILNAIINNSYCDFYNKEIEYRSMFNYPPFSDLILFELSSKNYELLKTDSQKLYNILSMQNCNIYKVYSPKSPFIQRINNKYRINILIRTKVSNEFYNLIYKKIKKYQEVKNKYVNFSITRNPMFI